MQAILCCIFKNKIEKLKRESLLIVLNSKINIKIIKIYDSKSKIKNAYISLPNNKNSNKHVYRLKRTN